MIYIDSRVGSAELFPRIKGKKQLTKLTFGDFMFMGCGPDGPISIGIERKTVPDLRDSFITGRLSAHQIPGLLNTYTRTYLVIEGRMKVDPKTGALMTWGRKWDSKRSGWVQDVGAQVTYRSVMGFLNTLENYCGIRLRFTENEVATARLVNDLHTWWSKGWEEHTSMHMFNSASEYHVGMKRPSVMRKIAADLPGIGWKRSEAVEKKFGSVRRMVNAAPEEWVEIDGIGKGIAKTVTEAVRKGE